MDIHVNPTSSTPIRRRNGGGKKALIIAAVVVALLLVVLAVAPPFVTVPTGHTGVVLMFGQVEDYTLDAGFHFKNPMQNVVLMDNRTQKVTVQTEAFSSDIQQVDVVLTVNYGIEPRTAQTLYATVGVSYYNTVMLPRILEDVKAVFTKYTAETIMDVRDTLSSQVKALLEPEMKAYGIQVESVSIENIDFTDAFTDAVEAKQVALQTKLKVETEQAQQVSVERSTAERQIIAANAQAQEKTILAQADADAAKIKADADAYARQVQAVAEAEANEKIAKSITEALLKYREITQWDGELPQIFAGEGTVPILNLTEPNLIK